MPRQADAVVDCQFARGGTATLWRTDPEIAPQDVELGRVHPDVADRVARSLAPVRDASVANATTAIPRTAPLLSRPRRGAPRRRLGRRAVADQPALRPRAPGRALRRRRVLLDLVADGPHALIGGTSGAGKSELLQSMVASLVTRLPADPPELPVRRLQGRRLVDGVQGRAPHRGLRHQPRPRTWPCGRSRRCGPSSTGACAVMEGRAKDLEEMLAKYPDEAPASLVIVVDEFATLVKEIPDFVAGIVDIAQRGRSLGIHLVLATQRPSGSVNDNILANTNLRMSLRMLDRAESERGDRQPRGGRHPRSAPRPRLRPPRPTRAGGVPVRVRQRAAHRRPTTRARPSSRTSSVEPVRRATAPRVAAPSPPAGGDDRRADPPRRACSKRWSTPPSSAQFPPARTPWREMLPEHVTVDEVLADHPRSAVPELHAGRVLPLGLVDDPEHQDQYPAIGRPRGGRRADRVRLGRLGADDAAAHASPRPRPRGPSPDDLVIFGIDFASRALRSIEPLPHVAAIGTGDDLESVTRIIALLDGEIERRKGALAELQAETLTAYRERGGRLPRVLLLVDGYPEPDAAFTGGGYGNPLDQWLEMSNRVILDGRQVGIHVVLTADRRGSVNALSSPPSPTGSSCASPRRAATPTTASRWPGPGASTCRPGGACGRPTGWCSSPCVSDQPDGAAQAAAIARARGVVRPAGGAAAGHPHRTAARAGRAHRRSSDGPTGLDVDRSASPTSPLEPVIGRPRPSPTLVIAGLPRSGRSTPRRMVIADGARRRRDRGVGRRAGRERRSPSLQRPRPQRVRQGRGARADARRAAHDRSSRCPGDRPRVLVVDDLDALEDATLNALVGAHPAIGPRCGSSPRSRSRNMGGFSMDPMLNEVRKARRALYLQPDDPVELFQTTGVRAADPAGHADAAGPGRPRGRSPPDPDPGRRRPPPAGDGADPSSGSESDRRPPRGRHQVSGMLGSGNRCRLAGYHSVASRASACARGER